MLQCRTLFWMGKSLNQLISEICQSLECFSIFHHISTSSSKKTLCETRRSTSMAECFWDDDLFVGLWTRDFSRSQTQFRGTTKKTWTRCWRACLSQSTNGTRHQRVFALEPRHRDERMFSGSFVSFIFVVGGGKLNEPLFLLVKNLFVWAQKFCTASFLCLDLVISINRLGISWGLPGPLVSLNQMKDRIENLGSTSPKS